MNELLLNPRISYFLSELLIHRADVLESEINKDSVVAYNNDGVVWFV